MALPVDLCESVEEVKVWHTDENLSDFQEKVLPFVVNDAKVLVIVVSDLKHTFDLVTSKISSDDVILHHESKKKKHLIGLLMNQTKSISLLTTLPLLDLNLKPS